MHNMCYDTMISNYEMDVVWSDVSRHNQQIYDVCGI